MTPRERSAFDAGLKHAADMATIAAVTIEARRDAKDVRQRAAIEALRGLAEGLKEAVSGEAALSARIVYDPSESPTDT